MKLQGPAWFSAGLALLLSGAGAAAQGTFQNLGFESARIILDQSSSLYPYAASATNALPGWRVTPLVSGFDVLYDTVSLGAAAVSIHDINSLGNPPIAGGYSVVLQGATPGIGIAAIWQTGQVPGDARTLTFWAQLGSLLITFNGQPLPYVVVGSGAGYSVYGTDISAFSGQTGELRFTALANTYGYIDNIQFSPQSIPEPGVFALSALGTLLVGWRILRRRR